jgi:hypothetical protein
MHQSLLRVARADYARLPRTRGGVVGKGGDFMGASGTAGMPSAVGSGVQDSRTLLTAVAKRMVSVGTVVGPCCSPRSKPVAVLATAITFAQVSACCSCGLR